ncbi:MAG: hypothetical protein GYA69_02245 [Candidatus Moranbacteria bacterium]|nr:hypothetical protein [Candidatus Moranbacteria bacterium]
MSIRNRGKTVSVPRRVVGIANITDWKKLSAEGVSVPRRVVDIANFVSQQKAANAAMKVSVPRRVVGIANPSKSGLKWDFVPLFQSPEGSLASLIANGEIQKRIDELFQSPEGSLASLILEYSTIKL